MLKKVKKTISENDLICDGDTILVGLSGGPDSVALLHILHALRTKLRLSLAAVYVNHGIRPKAAKEEEAFCARLCHKLNVKLTVVREDIPARARRNKKSLEVTGRDFRYRVYDQLARENGYDRIALGHHADDRVETILFRILRGTGRTGLAGIPVKRGRVVRPLFDCTKREVYGYLKKHRLGFCIDKSNARTDVSRNFIRNRLLMDIRNNLNPAVDTALLNLSDTAACEDEYLARTALRAIRNLVRITPGGKIELDLERFGNYDIWLRRRLLRHCATEASGAELAPDKIVVDRLDWLAQNGAKSISLPGNVQAERAGEKLVFYLKKKTGYELELKPGKACHLDNPRFTFRCRMHDRIPGKMKKERRARRVLMDRRKVSMPLHVRSIRPGDRFVPLGMKGSKKVAEYLIDKKVHRLYRDEIPVVCDNSGIVWLAGFEIANRVRVDHSTREVVTVEFTQRRSVAVEAV